MSIISAGTTSGNALVSTGDTTGQLVLQTNGTTTAVTIGTNQVVTLAQPLPVASGGTGATSLSGLTVGTATNATNATTATNLAGGSNGTIPYQSASGTTQMLAVGSSGQVLQTNGAGAPSWVTPSAGGYTVVTPVALSGNSVTISGIPAGVNSIVVTFRNAFFSNGALLVQLGTSGGISTSNYGSARLRHGSAGSHSSMGYNGDGFAVYAFEEAGLYGQYVLNKFGNYWTGYSVSGFINTSSGMGTAVGQWDSSSTTVTQVRLKLDSGVTFLAGEFSIMYL